MGFFKQTAKKPLLRSDAEKAAAFMGLRLEGLTMDDVRGRFRAKAFNAHPDSSKNGVGVAWQLEKAMAARATLLAWLEAQPDPDCTACAGAGVVARGVFTNPCPKCQK